MNETIAMTEGEGAIVREILHRCLPPGYRAYAFGSRATGVRLKPWSDLDLAIAGPEPLSLSLLGRLNREFDEAPLAWKVDVVDLNAISPRFRAIVDADKAPLD